MTQSGPCGVLKDTCGHYVFRAQSCEGGEESSGGRGSSMLPLSLLRSLRTPLPPGVGVVGGVTGAEL